MARKSKKSGGSGKKEVKVSSVSVLTASANLVSAPAPEADPKESKKIEGPPSEAVRLVTKTANLPSIKEAELPTVMKAVNPKYKMVEISTGQKLTSTGKVYAKPGAENVERPAVENGVGPEVKNAEDSAVKSTQQPAGKKAKKLKDNTVEKSAEGNTEEPVVKNPENLAVKSAEQLAGKMAKKSKGNMAEKPVTGNTEKLAVGNADQTANKEAKKLKGKMPIENLAISAEQSAGKKKKKSACKMAAKPTLENAEKATEEKVEMPANMKVEKSLGEKDVMSANTKVEIPTMNVNSLETNKESEPKDALPDSNLFWDTLEGICFAQSSFVEDRKSKILRTPLGALLTMVQLNSQVELLAEFHEFKENGTKLHVVEVYADNKHGIGESPRKNLAAQIAAADVLDKIAPYGRCKVLPYALPPGSRLHPRVTEHLVHLCLHRELDPPVYVPGTVSDLKKKVAFNPLFIFKCKVGNFTEVGYGEYENLAKRWAAQNMLKILTGAKNPPLERVCRGLDCEANKRFQIRPTVSRTGKAKRGLYAKQNENVLLLKKIYDDEFQEFEIDEEDDIFDDKIFDRIMELYGKVEMEVEKEEKTTL